MGGPLRRPARPPQSADPRVSSPLVGGDLLSVLHEVVGDCRIPRATYRLQFSRAFTFRDAEAIVPYLDELGISDVYASPILKARPNSTHGYDICDHSRLNPDLGGEADFETFVSALKKRGMGLVVDMVPNHMAINDPANTWWMDVLENGPASAYSSYFDIEWLPVKAELEGKVLLPMLEDQYGKVLEDGRLELVYNEGAFFIGYYHFVLPVAPRTYEALLRHRLPDVVEALGEEHVHTQELQSILTALSHLPLRDEVEPERIAERNREKEVVKRRIAGLHDASAVVREAIDASIRDFNGDPRDPRSFDLLDSFLGDQAHRLAWWRVAGEEINYRRFFDINEMAAIRVELPEVFQASHKLLLQLLAEGKVTGVRVDHPDGLWDPAGYFRSLQESYVCRRLVTRLGVLDSEPDLQPKVRAWLDECASAAVDGPDRQWPLYVVAEKILAEGEPLPDDWAVYGTTGYDFLNAVNGLFVDKTQSRRFDRICQQFTGAHTTFRNLANSTKKMIMLVSLASEINALSHQLERIAEKNRWYRDFTLNSLTFAIREVMAALPVYRTYYSRANAAPSVRDQSYIRAAVAEAKRRNPRTAEAVFDFIEDTLLLRNLQNFSEADRPGVVAFVMKFQQVSGPVMAKGVEDTAFYVHSRLVSLNDVGGEPDRFGLSVAEFHRQNVERQRRWPHSLLATSTHDTKRSEDVRVRISVLSEIGPDWRAAVLRWGRRNARKKTRVDRELAPDRNDEYLLYQTLLGAWPTGPLSREAVADLRERLVAYMHKAAKEAKVHTSWVNPNEEYEAAVERFVREILPDDIEDPFIQDLWRFQRRVSYFGSFSALSQVLLKLASPGVPDFYQGTEMWDLSLVDPDNRRAIDFGLRERLLAELKKQIAQHEEDLGPFARGSLATMEDGRAKLYVTYQALSCRRAREDVFAQGHYLPLRTLGRHRNHVCAFARRLGRRSVIAVAPRLVAGLVRGAERPPVGAEVWDDTRLIVPAGLASSVYRDVFTGARLSAGREGRGAGWSLKLGDVLENFPLALLESCTDESGGPAHFYHLAP